MVIDRVVVNIYGIIVDNTFESGTLAWNSLKPAKREVIFDAAVREFAENGYSSASMNSLVKNAGISKGSIFQYFRSKGDLFDSVVSVALGRIKSYLKSVKSETEDQCLVDRLAEFLRRGFQFIDEHPHLARIYFHLLRSGDAPFSSKQLAGITRSSTRFLRTLLIEAQDKQEISSKHNAERMAFLLNAMLEKLLSAYYSQHQAQNLDLYQAGQDTREEWISLLKSLLYGELFCATTGYGEKND
jgi:TetR/AcrR family transcriptional regulator